MSYLETPGEGESSGDVARLFAAERERLGRVPNFAKVFALRPEVYAAWGQLNGAIKAGMDLRRYELATVAAAQELGSSYCCIAHGSVLRERFYDDETVGLLVEDHHLAGLEPVDVAVMDLAEKVARDAGSVTGEDIDRLRGLGLSDTDVFQVVLAAAARCFFSTVLDAVGAEPDAAYRSELDPQLLDVLTVGRPVAEA